MTQSLDPSPERRQHDRITQAEKSAELARIAFAAGDLVTGIAAITLAAQLVQLAKIAATKKGDG